MEHPSRYMELHARLVAVQAAEPRHRLVGSRGKDGKTVPLDVVCGPCPSRKKCRRASLELADEGSRRAK